MDWPLFVSKRAHQQEIDELKTEYERMQSALSESMNLLTKMQPNTKSPQGVKLIHERQMLLDKFERPESGRWTLKQRLSYTLAE